MKKTSDIKRKSASYFLVVVFGAVILAALPGFGYFYLIRESSFTAALTCGVLLGLFGWYTLDGLIAVVAFFYRTWRKRHVTANDDSKKS